MSAWVSALRWAWRASVIRAHGGSEVLHRPGSWVTVEERGSSPRAGGASRARLARHCSGVVMTPWRRGGVAACPLDVRPGALPGGVRLLETAERANCRRDFGGRRPALRRRDPPLSRLSPGCQGAEARDDQQRCARWPQGGGEVAGAVPTLRRASSAPRACAKSGALRLGPRGGSQEGAHVRTRGRLAERSVRRSRREILPVG